MLNEDQLEAGTKAAQQEEMDRRKRLEQQRKDFPTAAVPEAQLGDYPSLVKLHILRFTFCVFYPEVSYYLLIFPIVDAASILDEVSHLVPALLSKQDVICLDSSGDEDDIKDPMLPALDIRDGKIYDASVKQ